VVQGVLNAVLVRNTTALSVHFTMTRNGVVQHNRYSILALLVGIVIAILYAVIFIGGPGGKTIGMMAVGIRCVRDESFAVVGYGKAFGRSLIELLLRITLIGFFLDYLWPLWDAKNQTLHDKAAKTVVLRSRYPR
jgi:uncharacterized RDD family membrane protein YckC